MRIALFLLLAAPLCAQGTLTPFQQQKARALLATKLPCLGCHELDGDGGRSAPPLTAVGARRSAAYIRLIVEDPQAAQAGAAMPRIAMPSAERDLIVRFLSRGAPDPGATVGSARSAPPAAPRPREGAAAGAADGGALYSRWCASCHGTLGRGDGPNARYLPVRPAVHANADLMRGRSDDALYDVIAGGGDAMGKSARMPSFGSTLTPAEVRALVAHLRALCRCTGPAWSRDGARP